MLVEQKKEAFNLHFLVTSVRAAALSFLSSFNSTSCSAVANCITGLLTTVIPCSSNASVSLFGFSNSLLVQIQQRPKQRQKHKYFTIKLTYHEKTCNSKERFINSFINGLIKKKLTPGITWHLCGIGSLTESLQIQVESKQHMCFVHAHHKNTSLIKIDFNFLTVLLFHHSYNQPFSFQQVSKWA